MAKRKIDVGAYGYTEEAWAALSEDDRARICRNDYYQRNKAEKQAYGREYYRRRKAEQQKET